MMPPARFWTDIPTKAFQSPDARTWIAVLPLAAIEQHGPHLPLGTDAMIGQAYLDRVLSMLPDDVPAIFLPQQSVGKSDEHVAFPGTLTLSAETAIRVWTELGESVHRAGIRKLVMISAHGGNLAAMEIVARELRVKHMMLAVYTAWDRLGYPNSLYPDDEARFGIHAGEIETSIMLAARPDLVDMPAAANFHSTGEDMNQRFLHLRTGRPAGFGWMAQDLNENGALGNAAGASATKGRASIDYGADRFIELLRDVQRFEIGIEVKKPEGLNFC